MTNAHALAGMAEMEGDVKTRLNINGRIWSAIFAALTLLLTAPFAGAATVGPVTDPLGVIQIPKGAPIVIGAGAADTRPMLDQMVVSVGP